MIDTTTTDNYRRPKAPRGRTQDGNGTSATLLSGGASGAPAAANPDDGGNGTDSGSDGRRSRGVSVPRHSRATVTAPDATVYERDWLCAERAPAAPLVLSHREGGNTSAPESKLGTDGGSGRAAISHSMCHGRQAGQEQAGCLAGSETRPGPRDQASTSTLPRATADGSGQALLDEHAPLRLRGGMEPNRGARRSAEKLAKRDAVRIGTLNINGYGRTEPGHPDNKWGSVHRMMRANKIAVLLVQEAHLDEDRVRHIEKFTAGKLKIHFSPHPERPTQRNGVAVVLNKRLVHAAGSKATEISPGRAIQVSIPWQQNDHLHVLCVYAPSANDTERKEFYNEIIEFYQTHPDLPRPTVMAGDFNNAEDVLDRIPAHDEPEASVEILDELKSYLGLMLVDGWRATFPTTKAFTFQRSTTLSRLDRIYVTEHTFRTARAWSISEADVRSDHSMVSVDLVREKSPEMGHGRPVFPAHLLKDKTLSQRMKACGMQALNDVRALREAGARSADHNPQTILARLKKDWMALARAREKTMVPKLLRETQMLEAAVREISKDTMLADAERTAQTAALTAQIRALKQKRVNQLKCKARARHRLEGETPTKYWTGLHKEVKPRDTMYALERADIVQPDGSPVYVEDSAGMAATARQHHMDLQRDDASARSPEAREADIRKALDAITVSIPEEDREEMGQLVTYEECVLALQYSKSASSPGLDGITYEVWKALHGRFVEDAKHPSRSQFDVLALLREVFADVQLHGVEPTAGFADGWMCPLYKLKGDKAKIASYRPITLLNTDYKLLTKVLALRLAAVAPEIVHPSQAGFVPGRRLRDQTQLAKLMINWAEATETNGAIVALDQEKAYDKISHDYLWRVLDKYGVPQSFIRTLQALYAHAHTSVMINGVLSEPYKVYRGVRQGDPMSCLLFDLAIEPLSAMIRQSNLQGFQVPGTMDVLKATLFADDTTVYLAADDDFAVLQDILDTWCSAAKAKFNISKTEIIPLGTSEHRKDMVETYRRTGGWRNYPQNVHIASDGEPVRVLGAFIGNVVAQGDVWSPTLAKLEGVLERWRRGITTLEGRRHVVQMFVGGMTQFLTDVQTMPAQVQRRLERILRKYCRDQSLAARHTSQGLLPPGFSAQVTGHNDLCRL